jgi:aminoethylphosphonate catabolism LysR family transcriptional regulator
MIYTQLRSFHAVAREGGFTAASRALNISQPTLTTQVKSLEEYFGVTLFNRRGRKIELTNTGHELFKLSRRIMSLEADAKDLLNAHGGFHAGHLKVGAVGPYHATEMLGMFSSQYPDIQVSVAVGNSAVTVERLLDYTVDVAVLAHTEDDPRVYAVPYSKHPVIIFVHKDHPFAKKKHIQIKELEGERFVLREEGSTTRRAFEKALSEEGIPMNVAMEIGSREAVWFAVAQGIGISFVSEIEFIPHKNLRAIPIIDCDIHTTAHIACLTERRDSHLISAFLDIAKKTLSR